MIEKKNKKLVEMSENSELSILENISSNTEITLDHIIDHSPRVMKESRKPGVLTTTLYFDEQTQHYFICNPMELEEKICVRKSILDINESIVGKDVLVQFEDDDVYRPIIIGVIQELQPPLIFRNTIENRKLPIVKKIDDTDRLIFTAKNEIVLQCGKSSIHLTRAGKVTIRGSYVLSRSTGVNSLKGGSVSIN